MAVARTPKKHRYSFQPDPTPPPTPPAQPLDRKRPDPLTLPREHAAVVDYCLQAGRFFGERFPSHQEFAEFLAANPTTIFDESSFYQCSMAYCAGGPVSEGYSTDVDRNAPSWFRQFESMTGGRRLRGADLLLILQTLQS